MLAKTLLGALTLTVLGCGTYRAKTVYVPPLRDEATNRTTQSSLVSQLTTELRFKQDSAMLTPAAVEALNIFLSKAVSAHDVSDVKVIAWSDKEDLSERKSRITDRDRDLAERRGRAIEDYLAVHIPKDRVEVFNMADRPNLLEQIFRTSDFRMKRALKEAGLSGRTAADQPRREEGRASQAVVLAVIERD